MSVSVQAVMRSIRNFFEVGYIDGTFTVSDGIIRGISLDGYNYICIAGSGLNDGVHAVNDTLSSETFSGRVWFMHPPKAFLAVCEQISAYADKNPTGSYVSQSFGGYSYNRGSGSGETGTAAGWQQAFSHDLAPYRHMFTEVVY